MSQAQNSTQHRILAGIPPSGVFHHNSPATALPLAHSPTVPSATSLGGAAYTTSGGGDVKSFDRSLPRWPILCSPADLLNATKWSKNSNGPSPALDAFSAAYLEHFDAAIRGKDGRHAQQFMDGRGRLPPSVASVLQRDSMGSMRTASSPLLGAPRNSDSWKTGADHASLEDPLDPSKGSGIDLHGVVGPSTSSGYSSVMRFPANPGFAERAVRFSALGPNSPSSFPAMENGNVGRSPCLANSKGNERAKPSCSLSGGELAGDASGPNWASHIKTSSETGSETSKDDKIETAGAKPFDGSLFVSPDCSQVDEDDGCEGQIADDGEEAEEGASSESNSSDICRGQQQEMSTANRLCRSTSIVGHKRKNSSSAASAKVAFPPSRKERKSGDGQLKRCKDGEEAADMDEPKAKAELSGSENSGLSNSPLPKETSKPLEKPKTDYIHVRARRGQATDSHSLAERVRREKISERMKFLQDLVPGCSKVTGKAMQLDEIINYVQSIQRQVEFLSMKLAAVTLRPDLHMDPVLRNQLQFATGHGQLGTADHASTSPSFAHLQPPQPILLQHATPSGADFQPAFDMSLERMNGNPVPPPTVSWDSFDIGTPKSSGIWDGDLRSVVEMGSGGDFGLITRQRDLQLGHVKREL